MQLKLSKSVIDRIAAEPKDQFFWDTEVRGFGLKVTPAGRKVYILQFRLFGGRGDKLRRQTIGHHGSPWTLDHARKEARILLARVASGVDVSAKAPVANPGMTVSELCDLYLAEGCATKKSSTLQIDRGRIERHIKPLLGNRDVEAITSADVGRAMADMANGKTRADQRTGPRGRAIVRGGRGTATRTIGLLGGILSFACERGFRQGNPVHGVKRYADRKNERYLSQPELAKLGQSLDEKKAQGLNPNAANIIQLLALTGARRGEIEALMWEEVDIPSSCLRLKDSKTGQRSVPLGLGALNLLKSLPRTGIYVFPGSAPSTPYRGLTRAWRIVREHAEMPKLRLHDLRHTFASIAINNGTSLAVIGEILGHADAKTTARYAHLMPGTIRTAADAASAQIADAIASTPSESPSAGPK